MGDARLVYGLIIESVAGHLLVEFFMYKTNSPSGAWGELEDLFMPKTMTATYNAEAGFSNYKEVLPTVMAVQRPVKHRGFTRTVSSQGALVVEVRAQVMRRGTRETRHPRAACSSSSRSSSSILATSTSTRSRTMAVEADLRRMA